MASAATAAQVNATPETNPTFGRVRLIHLIITIANLIVTLYLAAVATGGLRSGYGLSADSSVFTGANPVFGGLSLLPAIYLFNPVTLIWIVWLMLFGVVSLIGLVELAEKREPWTKSKFIYAASLIMGLLMGILPPLIVAWANLRRGF